MYETAAGRLSIAAVLVLFLSTFLLFLFIELGETGGETILSNLKLGIPGLAAAMSGPSAFILGLFAIIRHGERSISVFLSSVIGFLILMWVLAEVLFPH